MNKLFFFFLVVFFPVRSFAQAGEWVWLRGDNNANNPGTWGIHGVPNALNDPPALYETCQWQDSNGNFWIFGGVATIGDYNDLWKYDPLTNEWTWMKGPGVTGDPGSYGIQGMPSATNNPPNRGWGAMTWVDQNDNFWLYGGRVGGGVFYNDLWKYDRFTNELTWMKGSDIPNQLGIYGTQTVPDPLNAPGARSECPSAWSDLFGNLWMYGGYFNGSDYGDLWRFTISTNEWTWMKGSQFQNSPVVYGIKGVEDPANDPGARHTYGHWIDNNGNCWLFGGTVQSSGEHNDLWRFNPTTNNWTWISGSNTAMSSGNFGTKCIPDSNNVPPSRYENRACWDDQDDNFWLFGGQKSGGTYNDLWKYCTAENKWIWISGNNTMNPAGNWGIQGISNPANVPSGREGSASWYNAANRQLFLFGGGFNIRHNDLWRFTIDTTCGVCLTVTSALFSAPGFICPGTCVDFTNLSFNAIAYQWTFSGGNPSTSTDLNPINICYSNPGNYDVQLIATGANGSDTLLMSNYMTVYPYPPPQGILQSGDTLFANSGAVSYQWYYNGTIINGATDYFYIAPASGDYNVVATDANGCEVEAAIFDVVAEIQSGVANGQLEIYPNPVEDQLIIQKYIREKGIQVSVYNMLGEKFNLQPIETNANAEFIFDVHTLDQGMYYIEVVSGMNKFRSKFIKD